MKRSDTSKIFLLITVLLVGCSGASHYSRQNLAYLYKPGARSLHPEYMFHHISDSLSDFWFRIPSSELSYQSQFETQEPSTNIRLSLRLYLNGYPSLIRDTATVNIVTPETGRNGYLTGAFEVNTSTSDLGAEINLWDLNQGIGKRTFTELKRNNKNDRENYLLFDTLTGNLHFNPYINEETETLRIEYSRGKINKVHVRYYHGDFPLPPPPFSVQPFSTISFRADSSYTINVNDTVFFLDVAKKGFYHVQLDTNQQHGLTIYQMGSSYPRVTTPSELLRPMRFITSREEYSALEHSENIKEAIDKFWLKTGGTPDRARELIRVYYSRVESANKLFSSYTEGWKTDRGMIYLLFGVPDIVYRNLNEEIWIYGESNAMMSVRLVFSKLKNPFTPSDYTLERSELLKNVWYRAVEGWRQGRIF